MKNLIFILAMLFSLLSYSQSHEMISNNNIVDENFVSDYRIINVFKDIPGKEDLLLYVEKTNDTIFSIYVLNNSTDSIAIFRQDWKLQLIQEAKDQSGTCKPIEFWQSSTCGNSYYLQNIKSSEIIKTNSKAYQGNFQTDVRFKLKNNGKIYYSNSIQGNIDLSQFKLSETIKQNRSYTFVKRFAGDKIAERAIFLDPKADEEFSAAYKKHMEALKSKIKKRNEQSSTVKE
ncbi:hypothetical protein NZ698_02145 [Chryseobacterium sp. PBS4-4]|uniref:Uncharacterized protein n=1 Tax=Chryseobacterium edaphi TaxID=2976532 RepID=A0ABT2W168_9FLAO|nr:hypothetical protein [Chryseobacterium edaphi]MCU7615985.1 hypothetical protein [Chryseobacterium edaphi]